MTLTTFLIVYFLILPPVGFAGGWLGYRLYGKPLMSSDNFLIAMYGAVCIAISWSWLIVLSLLPERGDE